METKKHIVKFKAAGLKPDVRLKVFDNLEYHVHSVLLKLHSAFFRKFLDSPEKIIPASKEFAYEWVTKIDEDGSWHLVAAQSMPTKITKSSPKLKDGLQEEHEEMSFENLLKAIYNKSYELFRLKDLVRLTDMADYYCALRIVSRSLDAALLPSTCFHNKIFMHPETIISIARRLRNAFLFRECIPFLLGPWDSPGLIRYAPDPILFHIACKTQTRIYAKIGRLNETIHRHLHALSQEDPEDYKAMFEFIRDATATATVLQPEQSENVVSLPLYYRTLYSSSGSIFNQLWELEDLLSNQSLLNKELEAGEIGEGEDRFFCGTIDTSDLPWDTTEDDW